MLKYRLRLVHENSSILKHFCILAQNIKHWSPRIKFKGANVARKVSSGDQYPAMFELLHELIPENKTIYKPVFIDADSCTTFHRM